MTIILGGIVLLVVLGAGIMMLTGGNKSNVRLSPEHTTEDLDPALQQFMEGLSKFASPATAEEQGLIKLRLIQAGYKSKSAVDTYNALRVLLSVGLPLLFVPFFLNAETTLYTTIGAVLVCSTLGYYLPHLLLGGRVAARQEELLVPFPDALDLLVSSVEAGLGLDSALKRVANELSSAAPDLAGELLMVHQQTSAGVTRANALKQLALRTGLDEIKSLVNMLTQAERFGTSIAGGLRTYADITRQKRMSKAEEEAAKISPKMTVVMIICLMPGLGCILLGPAIVRVIALVAEG
jgi:tight adherence protein C